MRANDYSVIGRVPILVGDRLTLRPPRRRDLEDRLMIGRHPEIERMYGIEPNGNALTRHDAEAWLADLVDHPAPG